jgi:hypothetical protein
MQKVITIAIPTYNRRKAIYESVRAYCKMIKINNLENDLELLVIDNCSDKYDIFELLKEFQLEVNNSFLKILKNKTNVGMAKNIIKTMELSRGEFYFFTGDDEDRNYNNLAKVINLVIKKKNRYNIFISGQEDANGYQEIFSGIEKNQEKPVKNILEHFPIYYLGNGNTFAKKECLPELLECKRTFLEKYPIPQAALVLQNLKIKDEALLCNYNLSKDEFFEKYENNTLTSWSLNYSRFSIWYFYDKEFSLNPKYFYKRHPVLKPKNFLKLIILMNTLYHYSDTDKEKKDFRDFFLKNKLPFWYRVIVTNVVKSSLCSYLIFFFFLIRNLIVKKKIITLSIYRERKLYLQKKADNHHWNSDHTF